MILALLSGMVYINTMPHTAMTSDATAYFSTAKSWVVGVETAFQQAMRNTNTARMPWYVFLQTVLIALSPGQPDAFLQQLIRTVQIGLNAINIGLIGVFACLLTRSSRWGLAAGLVGVFYTPFLFQADKLLSETLGITFLLLFLYSLWRPMRFPWLTPLLLFLTLSNRFQTYWPMTLLAVVLVSIFEGRRFWQNRANGWTIGLVLGLGLLLQSFFWIFKVVSLKPIFLAQYVDTGGWSPLVEIYGMLSFLTTQEAVLPSWLPSDISMPVQMAIKWAFYHPDILLQRWLVNLTRFFALPDNGYQQTWLGVFPGALIGLHRLLLCGVWPTVGMAFRDRKLWIPLSMLGIWASMHALSHIELRYSLVVMPVVLGLSLLGWREAWQQKNWTMLGVLLLGCLIFYLPPGWPQGIALLLLGTLMTLSLNLPRRVAAMLSLLVLIPVAVAQLLEPQMSSQAMAIRCEENCAPSQQKIAIPRAFWERSAPVSTFLLLDASDGASDLNVTLNGRSLKPLAAPNGLSQQAHLLGGLRVAKDIRQYHWYPVPEGVLSDMQKSGIATVGLQLTQAQYATVYQDNPQNNHYCIPDPDWNRFSIYKALYDGDGRPIVCLPAPAGATGPRYRMMLLRLLTEEANQADYPRANLNQMPDGRIWRYIRLTY